MSQENVEIVLRILGVAAMERLPPLGPVEP